jgi:uncharacterized protein (TIGR02996 family)
MAVHFVYRNHYDNPTGFHVRRFKADTVLGWFQSIWEGIPDDTGTDLAAHDHALKLIGRDVYCFANIFEKTAELGWQVPRTDAELEVRLNDALYVNEMTFTPHCVQVFTDDDELEMAVYIFDDQYATKHPERVAFLLHDGFALPDGGRRAGFRRPRDVPEVLAGAVAGDGRTYFANFAAYDGGNLSDLGPGAACGVVPGVRVHDLPRLLFALDARTDKQKEKLPDAFRDVLTGVAPAVKGARGSEAALLKAVRAEPNDTACWSAYSDWLAENGRPTLLERVLAKSRGEGGGHTPRANPKRDVIAVGTNVAQAGKHVDRWDSGRWLKHLYHHLVFFDDLWANAHPHLAGSILRAANRWDPL